MRTINNIMASYDSQESDQRNGIEGAIMAAYWAGQEDMRGRIVRGIIERRKTYKGGRYHRVEDKAQRAVIADGLLGGEGRDDSAEFLDWGFEL